jgi:hypothetical protein
MKEEFLHYLWKYSLYDKEKLIDTEKNKITILDPGIYNRDSGPDFFNARISVDGTIWAGNIEGPHILISTDIRVILCSIMSSFMWSLKMTNLFLTAGEKR